MLRCLQEIVGSERNKVVTSLVVVGEGNDVTATYRDKQNCGGGQSSPLEGLSFGY